MEKLKKIEELLEGAKTYYLATVEGAQPRVRPYGAYVVYDDKLYIMAFYHTNATKQIEHNPKAEICALHGLTLRIECKLVEDNRQEVKDALLNKMPVLKPILGEKAEQAVMYQVTDAKASFYKMMELVESYEF
ncbi:MAG: pyridoxamine 5'-phosphate oxidase family protein [Muribaculaceae bacterium]|nr:pyridoxamine 5'-phosphate oxidase family protein [Muribaculaceae bacterium]